MSKRNKDERDPLNLEGKLINKKLCFSFEYYDTSNERFCISKWAQKQIKASLFRLKDISTKTFNEMRRDERVYHFGEVIWEKTIFPKGFPNQTANALPAFHFSLLGVNNQLARVYGAYAPGIFYIVWFDLNHEIWPTPLKNT